MLVNSLPFHTISTESTISRSFRVIKSATLASASSLNALPSATGPRVLCAFSHPPSLCFSNYHGTKTQNYSTMPLKHLSLNSLFDRIIVPQPRSPL